MEHQIPFRREELVYDGYYPEFRGVRLPCYRYPLSPRENLRRLFAGESALWTPRYRVEYDRIDLTINPDNVARGPDGGPDMFGVMWKFDPAAGGSMVAPGHPTLTEAGEWKRLRMPDVDAWDWQGFTQRELHKLDTGCFRRLIIMNGLFERLISLMDFSNAAIALIDEDQQSDVRAFFAALCDVYERIILRAKQYLDIDVVTFHDDWGTQRAPIFSTDTCREMLLPSMKRLAAFAHSKGVFFEHHSCGKVDSFLPLMIEAGIDSWEGQENANDKIELLRRYGDRLAMYVCPPDASDLREEELPGVARQFFDRLAPGARAIFSMTAQNQRLDAQLYALGRRRCGGMQQ